jgi:biotin transport system substrate-specific component
MTGSAPPALRDLHRLVWTALLAALVAVGAFLHVPIGPAPITLQPYFVLLAGFILGWRRGMACLGLYLAAGLLGLPVFSGGRSGFAHLLGPTGGYLFGFVLAAGLAGLATRRREETLGWVRGLAWALAGLLVAYGFGLLQLKLTLGLSWGKAFAVGAAPFLLWDIGKAAAAVASYRFLYAKRLLPG